MTPEEMLKNTTHLLRSYEEAKRKHVAVGLPKEDVGGKIYGDGIRVIDVAIWHEYGFGNNPRRSFLRTPYETKKSEMALAIHTQFKAVANGRDVDTALGRVGVSAANISKGAFTSRGYGQWPDIQASTKNAKGSSQVLIDTGTLRNSVTWQVRDAS